MNVTCIFKWILKELYLNFLDACLNCNFKMHGKMHFQFYVKKYRKTLYLVSGTTFENKIKKTKVVPDTKYGLFQYFINFILYS